MSSHIIKKTGGDSKSRGIFSAIGKSLFKGIYLSCENQGPQYAIEKTYLSGAYLLRDVDSNQILSVTNARFLKKYYP